MPSTTTTLAHGGDDLDDGLLLDSALLAASDAEDEDLELDEDAQPVEGEETGVFDGFEEEEGEPVMESKTQGKKRKAEAQEKAGKAEKRSRQEADPAPMATSELYQYFAESLKKTYAKASEMELADLKLPESAVLSTSSYTSPRDLANLPDFIQSQLPSLPKKLKRPGTPSIVILASSGMRCADIVRSLKAMEPKPPGEIGKLFAKHFKVAEQVEYLRKTKVVIAVGTPGRIGKLIKEDDALHIRQQTIILIDQSYHDSKLRTVLTIPEIRDELWRTFLGDKEVRDKLLAPGVRFAVY